MIKKKIFIIIVTYNGFKWVDKCLQSILPKYDVIVVDNNSTDSTLDIIQKKFPKVKVFTQRKNLGFGAANNIGISFALKNGADYVFLLNQDAYLEKNCIETLISVHKQFPDYMILSPIHMDGVGEGLDEGFSKYISYDINASFFSDIIIQKNIKAVYKFPFVNAAGWLIPRKCLLKVGGFDPIFFHYGEDINFCQRVKFYGYEIGVVPNAFMIHDRYGSAIKEDFRFSERYFSNLERRSKMKWADLNLPIEKVNNQIKSKKQKLKKENKRALATLNFQQLKGLRMEKRLLEKVEKEVQESRKRNTILGNINRFYF